MELIELFGPSIRLPGVLGDHFKWLGSDQEDFYDAIRGFCVDFVLSGSFSTLATVTSTTTLTTTTVTNATTVASPIKTSSLSSSSLPSPSSSSSTSQQDIRFSPVNAPLPPLATLRPSAECTGSTHQPPAPTTRSVLPDIALPPSLQGRRWVSVIDISKRLCQDINYHTYKDDERNSVYYYAHGYDVLDRLRAILQEWMRETCSTEQARTFIRGLLQRGILHSYTTHDDWEEAFVVPQPLRTPQVLNTFLTWPGPTSLKGTAQPSPLSHWGSHSHDTTCTTANTTTPLPQSKATDDPMDIILRLSHQMDELCMPLFGTTSTMPEPSAVEEFEVAVCQLQQVPFPTHPVEHVTFALNLFNLILRHAMLLTLQGRARGGWVWPSTLEELQPFLQQLGYHVAGGQWISLAQLQASLYGLDGTDSLARLRANGHRIAPENSRRRPKGSQGDISDSVRARNRTPMTRRNNLWQRFKLGGRNTERVAKYQVQRPQPIIRTDPRILFVTTWGTASSPRASTVYADTLHESLQSAAEDYCRQHVQVLADGQVILPELLSWYCDDFGGQSPHQVLQGIRPYLSFQQKQQLQASSDLKVKFAQDFCWVCGPQLGPILVDPHKRQHSNDGPGGCGDDDHDKDDDMVVWEEENRRFYGMHWANEPSIRRDLTLLASAAGPLHGGYLDRSKTKKPQNEASDKYLFDDIDQDYFFSDDDDDDDDDDFGPDDNSHAFFASDVSALTMGSEFGTSRRRLYS